MAVSWHTITPARVRLLSMLGVALVAQALLLLNLPGWVQPGWVQTVALLVWAAWLPGHLLVEIVGRDFGAAPTQLEWGVYAVGAGYFVLTGVLLLLSYLPGPLAAWQLHVGVDLVWLALVAAAWPIAGEEAPAPIPLPRWEVAALVAIMALAGGLRLLHLGYAEFHGDEARAVLRAAAVVQGYEDVLFLHKKGPGEILLPTAVFLATGHMTEATARLPFALANLAALAAVYWLGRRLVGPMTGLLAALLLALDGFLIGFSRLVQYQSLVILCSALVLLVLVRLWQRPQGLTRGLILAAICLATGLWAHYEAGLIAIPALLLVGALWRREPARRGALLAGVGWAILVGAGLLALFYWPFVRHAQFNATYTYLVERRIAGEGFPVNNVADFFIRLTTYSSSYYALFIMGVLLLALLAAARQAWQGRGAWLVWLWGALVAASVALTVWQPDWATVGWPTVGSRDWLIGIWLALLLPVWLGPRLSLERRLLWLWWGALFVIMLGFTSKPRTHVYVFMTPWALLVAAALHDAAGWAARQWPMRRVAWASAAAAVLLALVFGGYVYQLFAYTRTEILRTWDVNWPRGYWRPYALLDNRALFGFPLANGWKVVGELYRSGQIEGDYATNEVEFWTPIWYTHGRMRCEDRADWFFQIDNPQPDPAGYRAALSAQLADKFPTWGTVTIHDDPRMIIRRQGADPASARTLALADYAAAFDAHATPDLPLGYPVVEPPIPHPTDFNFGGKIRLEGYALDAPTPLAPGDTIRLTLYWRALQDISQSYKVFNQSYYGDGVMVAQQDGYPVCGSRGTWLWDPGELIADVHLLTIAPDAPDGLYPLYTGLYIEETFERLSLVDATGAAIADQAHLTDLRVGPAPQ